MNTRFDRSDELCAKAQRLIPGGAHTYSKGADQSPKLGPKFIERGQGARVWDVDGNEYVDWAMGLTAVCLGHAYEPVLEAVRAQLLKGANFQCPTPLEVELAEHFLSLLPGAEMVKFAKNGSTATTAAVKMARAFTGKSVVAYCADHGFFSYDDWYMVKKPNNRGIPQEIAALSDTFRYNDIASVEEVFKRNPGKVACIILEPMEFDFPQDGYLKKIQDLCRKEGALLIIDEMITGFRLGMPGVYPDYGITPDLTTWGKGMGNGFSACALAGRRDVLRLGGIDHDEERVFLVSTTHGAEAHGLAAALATLKELKRTDAVRVMKETGQKVRGLVEEVFRRHGLQDALTVKGHPAWQLVLFRNGAGQTDDAFKTLFLQEVVKHGLLFRGSFVPTISHGPEELEQTVAAFDAACAVYKKALEAGSVKGLLVGDPVKPVFRKFN